MELFTGTRIVTTMAVSTQLLVGIAIIYLAMILGVGYYGYKKTKSADDYMVAGRNTPPIVLALSYGATFISTSAIVGFGGMAAQYGMSLMWLTVLCIVVGVIIAFIFFGKRVRRKGKELGAMTYPELLGKIFAARQIWTRWWHWALWLPLFTAPLPSF